MSIRSKQIVVALVAGLAGVCLFAPQASADDPDPFKAAGLKGGENGLAITKINADGELTVSGKGTTVESTLLKLKGPDAAIAAQCAESGYRVDKVVGADGIATTFKGDQAQELGTVAANLRALGMKVKAKREPAEKALVKSLTDACASGQSSIRLGVTARLFCKRVKPGPGDSVKEYVSDEVTATFKLTCQ